MAEQSVNGNTQVNDEFVRKSYLDSQIAIISGADDWDLLTTGELELTSTVSGPVIPFFNDLNDLGSLTNRWKDLYLGSNINVNASLTFQIELTGGPADILYIDDFGITYSQDYSPYYVDRSLVDKEYVDIQVATKPNKYSEAGASLVSGVPYTVTHYLGTELIQVTVWDLSTGELLLGFTADNRMPNEVDITVSVTGTYDIIIVG